MGNTLQEPCEETWREETEAMRQLTGGEGTWRKRRSSKGPMGAGLSSWWFQLALLSIVRRIWKERLA